MKTHYKSLFIILLCLTFFTSRIFAIGAGIQAGIIPGFLIDEKQSSPNGFTGNITGTLSLFRFPLTAGSGLVFGKSASVSNFGFSAFADYRVLDLQLHKNWLFYSGFGASAKILTSDFSAWQLTAGARFFLGVKTTIYDGFLELYGQQNLVPTYVKNLNDSAAKADFMLCLPLEAGIRMHF